jgi:hypothetical protein
MNAPNKSKSSKADPNPNNGKKETILRNLKKAEDMIYSRNYRSSAMYVKAAASCALKSRSDPERIPRNAQTGKLFNVPTNVLQHLQTRNRVHFGQAKTTQQPVTTSPLGKELVFLATPRIGQMNLTKLILPQDLNHYPRRQICCKIDGHKK